MTWATLIGFDNWLKEEVERLCTEIGRRDPTFRWRIGPMFEKYREKYPYVLAVFSVTKDQAIKRGLLITRRYLKGRGKLLFWVMDVGEEAEALPEEKE